MYGLGWVPVILLVVVVGLLGYVGFTPRTPVTHGVLSLSTMEDHRQTQKLINDFLRQETKFKRRPVLVTTGVDKIIIITESP